MTLTSPVRVHVETPVARFGEVMNQIRSWLDTHKIEPAAFKSDVAESGTIVFDIQFNTEDEAYLFERKFA